MTLDFLGLFLFFAGYILGLGAVTVIDLHGFLGRTSSYWTEATIRTHKVTKPLIWIGISLVIVGGALFYRHASFWGTPFHHAILAGILLLNGCYLSFVISPALLLREKQGKAKELLPVSMQKRITVSFLISVFAWWGSLILFIAYLLSLISFV